MSGFTGLISFRDSTLIRSDKIKFPDITNRFYPKLESVCGESDCFFYYGNSRFYQAPLMHSGSSDIFGLEGVYLNVQKDELERKIETVRESRDLQPPADFLNTLKKAHGTFSGFCYNKNLKELFLYTDQTASRQIFYYRGKDLFVFSSSIFLLCDILSQLNIKLSLCEPACYMFLSLGYYLKDYTLVNEIKKLEAGKYLMVNENEMSIQQYHSYHRPVEYKKINRELLEELDLRFKASVVAEYEYDKKNGLKHIANLSGGLDTRMNIMDAMENGYRDITALTFSEGMEPDELVARQISDKIKIQHIVILLNNGLHLFDLESPLLLNNCAVYYFGSAHTFSTVQKLDFKNYGLMHNGLLAESSKGNYLTEPKHRMPQLSARYAVSGKYLDRLQTLFNNEIAGLYPDEEMFIHYSRGFNAIHNGSWMTRPFTESVYTFMEPHFAELAYSISPKLRHDSYLTIEWLKTLHQDMASYNWAPFGIPPTNNKVMNFSQRVRRKLGRIVTRNYKGPNPLDHYYKSNNELRSFINEYYSKANAWSIMPIELKKDVEMLFTTGIVSEKLLCISLLKSLDLLFLNKPE